MGEGSSTSSGNFELTSVMEISRTRMGAKTGFSPCRAGSPRNPVGKTEWSCIIQNVDMIDETHKDDPLSKRFEFISIL